METTETLHSFIFEILEEDAPVEFVTVYSASEENATDKFFEALDLEYDYVPKKYSVEDEGALKYPSNETFDSKYECVNPFGEDSFIDKWDYFEEMKSIADKTPQNVWSVYGNSSIACGMFLIDVIGYHITTKPGQIGEFYEHFEGEFHF
jgi:hypothetical protein